MQILNFSEIEYIYTNGSAIQNGYLTFKESEQEEIYEALGFKDWKNIVRVSDIEDLLLNPNADKAQSVIDIDTFPKFERVRMILIGLMSTNNYDISNRIIKLVNARYDEWVIGKRVSDITIRTTDVVLESDNTEKLKAQLQANAEQMKKMEEMIAQLAAQQKDKSDKSTEVVEESPKKSGRSSKK